MLVQEKTDRIQHQANDLTRAANDSLDELLSGRTVLSLITIIEGVGYAIDQTEKIAYLVEYRIHNSRNRPNDVRMRAVLFLKSIRETTDERREQC